MAGVATTERRTNRVLLAAGIVMVVVSAILFVNWLRGVARGYEPDCDDYSFERSQWRADNDGTEDDRREHQAEALAECGTLEGLTRAEVTARLGPHQTKILGTGRYKWAFGAGWVNDGIGPGDGQLLYVMFDREGRVERAKLAYPQ